MCHPRETVFRMKNQSINDLIVDKKPEPTVAQATINDQPIVDVRVATSPYEGLPSSDVWVTYKNGCSEKLSKCEIGDLRFPPTSLLGATRRAVIAKQIGKVLQSCNPSPSPNLLVDQS